MDIILSKNLGQDIAEIIMTNLWKKRFNIVIKEVQEIDHSFCKGVCLNMHSIKINDYTELRYNDRYNEVTYCESWFIFTPPNNPQLGKHNTEIWKK